MPQMKQNSLIVVVGPTASGKTALAVELAKALDGEVVSADSMQIYEGMDIATAKPDQEEMQGIPHHLIGFLPPENRFSVAEYAPMARKTIDDILSRGKVPILAGGTGLYVQAVVDHILYDQDAAADPALRKKLEALAAAEGNKAVWDMLNEIDPETAVRLHPNNLGRVIRAIEVLSTSGYSIRHQEASSRREPCPYQCCQIGLRYADRAVLYDRIDRRVDRMMEAGLLQEAEAFWKMGLTNTAAQAIGYKELFEYFEGRQTLAETIERLKTGTRHYAKRQLTWFGRDERIHWIQPDALPANKTVLQCALEWINLSQGVCIG